MYNMIFLVPDISFQCTVDRFHY